MPSPMNILIVDDQPSARLILSELLSSVEGVRIHEAASLAHARRVIASTPIDVSLIDVRLDPDTPNWDGITLVSEIREQTTAIPVVVTRSSEWEQIRAAMRAGAYDYILKDHLCEEMVLPIIEGLRKRQRLEQEVLHLQTRLSPDGMLSGLVGTSEVMAQMRERIRKAAPSDRPVLIIGPSGAGKEVVVKSIHTLSSSASEPLMDINCGAIPEGLMESELFGAERGAYANADRRRDGYLTSVGRGTLFLDELAELPMVLQAKLLRVLESGRFRRLGSTTELRFQGRVVAATHANLEERVREGRFREDLFHRLNVLAIRVPPLDERKEDIPALVAHFCRQQPKPVHLSEEAFTVLAQRSWPGNVRQVRNLIDRLSVFHADEDPISAATVIDCLTPARAATSTAGGLQEVARAFLRMPMEGNRLEIFEAALIREALAQTGDNKSAAARLLGVDRKVVERRSKGDSSGGGANAVE